jgi:hypothetical protein
VNAEVKSFSSSQKKSGEDWDVLVNVVCEVPGVDAETGGRLLIAAKSGQQVYLGTCLGHISSVRARRDEEMRVVVVLTEPEPSEMTQVLNALRSTGTPLELAAAQLGMSLEGQRNGLTDTPEPVGAHAETNSAA